MPQASGENLLGIMIFTCHHHVTPARAQNSLHIPEVGRRLDTRYTADKASSECGAVEHEFYVYLVYL